MLSPNVASVWIGPQLTRMERLCVRSFLRFGYRFRLYVYDEPKGVPEGVELVDAATIVPAARVFLADNGAVGDFANYFKYRALCETGGCWTEMDEVCLRPWTDLGLFISSEADPTGTSTIDQAAIQIEAAHPLMMTLVEWCEQRLQESGPFPWATFGPSQFARAVALHELQVRVCAPGVFCPLPWWEAADLLVPGTIPATAYGIQLWNEVWRREQWDKDAAPAGSLYALLCDQVGV